MQTMYLCQIRAIFLVCYITIGHTNCWLTFQMFQLSCQIINGAF